MIQKTSRYILLLLCLRITEAAPEDEDRIVGGHEVSPPHKYPFQVYFASGHYACAGSVLDRHHILTAAHCVYDPETGDLQDPSDCFIVAGAHTRPGSGSSCKGEVDNRSLNIEETWQIGEVQTIFAKDDYNSETHENDIAILRLRNKLTFDDFVRPIGLPSKDSLKGVTRQQLLAGEASFHGILRRVNQQTLMCSAAT